MTMSAATVFAQPEDQGKYLARVLVESEDATAVWKELSDTERKSVQDFASQATQIIQHLEQEALSNDELVGKIAVLPNDLALALKVSLIQVDTVVGDFVQDDVSTAGQSYRIGKFIAGAGVLGNELYRLEHDIYWTSDGRYLTAANRTYHQSVYGVGWEFKGLTKDNQRGGKNYNFYESDVQGHFRLAIIGQDFQNLYPRIWLKAWYDGDSEYKLSP
ncbi:hypothetical protein [Bacillus chungangensis]|uniref:Inverse autotransporter beta-domain domain-containing protein n=1 Tax=Bacillus chungangensis TaxID=587633 RepID=A0ABT9WQB8_9BACI|nr:hypothetical protein [Bacillus chungangensis]MDQ0175366.1 hypothetical protein [Bacillus chungangensis]